jgi:hypothetical protein
MDSESSSEVSVSSSNSQNDNPREITEVSEFSESLADFVEAHDLPTENMLVDVGKRKSVFLNLEKAISDLSEEQRERSLYLSKFSAAVAGGLFDAALNYL